MSSKGKLVAAYVRVSTVGQNEAGQRAELDRWLTGNGIDPGVVRWFVDKGRSGDSLKRPAFEQLQDAVFAGEVGTVVVWKLDRLSRSLRDGINVLRQGAAGRERHPADRLQRRGIVSGLPSLVQPSKNAARNCSALARKTRKNTAFLDIACQSMAVLDNRLSSLRIGLK